MPEIPDGTSLPSLPLMQRESEARVLFGNASFMPSFQLTWKPIAFTQVAGIVCRLNIFFRMSATTCKRYDMVKVNNMMRQDGALTDIAEVPIPLKYIGVVDSFDGRAFLSGIVAPDVFVMLHGVGLTPCFISLFFLFAVSVLILSFAMPNLFVMSGSIGLASTYSLFHMGSLIIAQMLLSLFAMDDIVLSFLSSSANFTERSIPAIWVLRKKIERSLDTACIADFQIGDRSLEGIKQRKLNRLISMVQFTHDKNQSFLSSRLRLLLATRGQKHVYLPLHYTTDQLLKQVYTTFETLLWRCNYV